MIPLYARICGGTLFLAMAGVWLSLGVQVFRRASMRKKRDRIAVGTVVGWQSRGRFQHSPDIEFQTESGQKVVFTASTSSSIGPRRGKQFKIHYDPNDPQNADFNSLFGLGIGPFILLFLDVVFFAIAILFFCGG